MAIGATVAIIAATSAMMREEHERQVRSDCSHTYIPSECDSYCLYNSSSYISQVDTWHANYEHVVTNSCSQTAATSYKSVDFSPTFEVWGLGISLFLIGILFAIVLDRR